MARPGRMVVKAAWSPSAVPFVGRDTELGLLVAVMAEGDVHWAETQVQPSPVVLPAPTYPENYALEPNQAVGQQGVWVTTHERHLWRSPQAQGTAKGQAVVQLGRAWYAQDPAKVVTVQIAETDGGVRTPPRPWPPPPP